MDGRSDEASKACWGDSPPLQRQSKHSTTTTTTTSSACNDGAGVGDAGRGLPKPPQYRRYPSVPSARTARNPPRSPPPPPAEKILTVTLEELAAGFRRRLKVKRRVEGPAGTSREEAVLLTVNGRPGWREGTRVTYAGAGDILRNRLAQAVVVTIKIATHNTFVVKGDDLHTTVKASLWDALYGYTVQVPRLGIGGAGGGTGPKEGNVHCITVASVTPDTPYRIKGGGLPRGDAPAVGAGDLVVAFELCVPAHARAAVLCAPPPGPVDYRMVPVACVHCARTFTQHGPGAGDRCVERGTGEPCEPESTSLTSARAQAAHNGLCALLTGGSGGDPYAVGRYLLRCCAGSARRARSAGAGAGADAGGLTGDTAVVQGQSAGGANAGGGYDLLSQPLRLAAKHGGYWAALLMLRAGASVNIDTDGGEILDKKAMLLLSAAAKRDRELVRDSLMALEKDEKLVVIAASVPGALAVLMRTLASGGRTDVVGRLLLHPAAGIKARNMVVDSTDGGGDHGLGAILLCTAASHGDVLCAKLLLDAGVPPDAYIFSSANSIHATTNDQPGPRHLQQQQRQSSKQIPQPMLPPLHAAAAAGHVEVIAALMHAGADGDLTAPSSVHMHRTALHLAVAAGSLDTVEILLQHGVRTSICDASGQRPLDLALDLCRDAIVRALRPAIIAEILGSMQALTVMRLLMDDAEQKQLRNPQTEQRQTADNVACVVDLDLLIHADTAAAVEEESEDELNLPPPSSLRAHLVVLEEALRALSELSARLDLQTPLAGAPLEATRDDAISTYIAWQRVVNATTAATEGRVSEIASSNGSGGKNLGVADKYSKCDNVTAGQRAINALLAAGVTLKAHMQRASAALDARRELIASGQWPPPSSTAAPTPEPLAAAAAIFEL